MKNNFVSIGKILNFHGVKGEAKLGYTKNREDFLSRVKLVYLKIDSEYKKFEIEYLKFMPKCAIVKFKGINSINDIVNYKGAVVFIDELIAREFLEEDEFLIDELVGMNVYDGGGKRLGSVVGVCNNGASDLLSVKTNSKNICLVPFVKAIVTSVDMKTKRIQINNLEGLLS